jgi:hypothetical protein
MRLTEIGRESAKWCEFTPVPHRARWYWLSTRRIALLGFGNLPERESLSERESSVVGRVNKTRENECESYDNEPNPQRDLRITYSMKRL